MGNCCISKQYLECSEEEYREIAELKAGAISTSQEIKAVSNLKSQAELTLQEKTSPRVFRAVRHSSCGVENRSLTPTAPPAPRSLYPDLSRVRPVSPPPSPSVFCPPPSFTAGRVGSCTNTSGRKARSHSLPTATHRVDRQSSFGRAGPRGATRAVSRSQGKTRGQKRAARRARNERGFNNVITIRHPTETRAAGCRKKKVKFAQRCN